MWRHVAGWVTQPAMQHHTSVPDFTSLLFIACIDKGKDVNFSGTELITAPWKHVAERRYSSIHSYDFYQLDITDYFYVPSIYILAKSPSVQSD